MEVEVTESYNDVQLNRQVQKGEHLKVTAERGAYLIGRELVVKVADIVEPKKEEPKEEKAVAPKAKAETATAKKKAPAKKASK